MYIKILEVDFSFTHQYIHILYTQVETNGNNNLFGLEEPLLIK